MGNVSFWAAFQDICRRQNVAPTYLITSEVTEDAAARSLLRGWVQAGEAEVGAHLHPWTTAPFRDEPGMRFNDPYHAFMSELPIELVFDKLTILTRQIESSIGVRPTAFRAGRYGLNDSGAILLADLGYAVDSSVTPLLGWSTHQGVPGGGGGPDFRSHSPRPFLVEKAGDPALLEIPVTIAYTNALLRRAPGLSGLYGSLPVRAASRLSGRRYLRTQPVWLHPAHFEHSVADLKRLFDLQMDSCGVAVMMVHSSELMPSGSPRTPTREAADRVMRRLEAFLAHVRQTDTTCLTLSAAADMIRSTFVLPSLELAGGQT